MTALPPDAVADLYKLVAELEQRLGSSFTAHDAAIARQAATDIENGRLINELSIAREQQNASAEILHTIANAKGDAERALYQIAEASAHLFGAPSATIHIAEGDGWAKTIRVGESSKRVGAGVPETQLKIGGRNMPGTIVGENRQVHIPDVDNVDPEIADWPGLPYVRAAGTRSMSGSPLRREGNAIGALIVYRDHLAPFTDDELALQQSFADQAAIAIENSRLFNETREALERQTATAEILKVIAASPSDAQPVFDAIVNSAAKLFQPCAATITTLKDGKLHWNAVAELVPSFDHKAAEASYPIPFDPDRSPSSRAILERRIIEIPDTDAPGTPESTRKIAANGGFRSIIFVPLVLEDRGIGTIILTQPTVGYKHSDKQLALIQTFADQAVIAIENARLFNETKEALERQTATAEILKVIAASPSDAQPVFEAIADSAKRLLGGFSATVLRFLGDELHLVAFTPTEPAADEGLQASFPRSISEFPTFALVRTGETVQFPDSEAEHVPQLNRELARLRGFRSVLFTPLMNQGTPVGMISVTRAEPGAFAADHVQLLQTFADQAVIAIENARLFNETRQALERQTATSDVLKVIAGSPSDVQPVFDTIVASANRLIGGFSTAIFRYADDAIHLAAFTPTDPAGDAVLQSSFPVPFDKFPPYQLVLDGAPAELVDTELEPAARDIARARGYRSMLFAPLMNEDKAVGIITVTRRTPGSFGEPHVQLLQMFAAQSVIAIENVRLFNETREALEQQKASADILRVVSNSVADAQPVFDEILRSIEHLFGGDDRFIYLAGADGLLHIGAAHGANAERVRALYPVPLEGTASEVAFRERRLIRYADVFNDPEVPSALREVARRIGTNYSMALAPMLWEDRAIGSIFVGRTSMKAFSEKECSLLGSFADQAVIAIQNARLFNETKEALERQTATADILKVIASSPSDTTPVFEAIASSAKRLLGGFSTAVFRLLDGTVHLAAFTPTNPAADEALKADFPQPVENFEAFRLARHGEPIAIPDTEQVPHAPLREIARLHGFRSMLWVPMVHGGVTIGIISVTRVETGAFAPHHVQLLQTFADQAVIAIENARLFDEVKQRTEDLSESLQQQTATADVLKVISRSAFDLPSVLDTLVSSAALLCGDPRASIYLLRDGLLHLEAAHNNSAEWIAQRRSQPLAPSRDTPSGRAALTGQLDHVPDLLADPDFARPDLAQLGNYRATLNVPMTREGVTVGVLSLARPTPGPFTQRQVELVQTFADQAVIAIENVRLFDEVEAKTHDLTEALEYQTAIGDVLNVISRSPNNLQPVIETIVHTARRLCQSDYALMLHREDDGVYRIAAHSNASRELMDWMQDNPVVAGDGSAVGIVAAEKQTVHLPDVLTDPRFTDLRRQRQSKVRTMLGVPLLRGQEVIGVVFLARTEVNPFSDKQIDLVTNFADQAVIAIENVRLFDEVQSRTRDLSEALTYQTGSANILRVIASSPTDVKPVLTAIVESACELCEANDAVVLLKDGDDLRYSAHHGPIPVFVEKQAINRNFLAGRSVLDRAPMHLRDVLSDEGDEFPLSKELARKNGIRSLLCVPLLRDNESVGAILLRRLEVQPFNEKQIALLRTFADQAVIAIGNVRLFDEVQAKTRDLSEALTYQTGSANILNVIASSPTDVGPVLRAIVESSCELCGAYDAVLRLSDGESLRLGAHHGPIPVNMEPWTISRNWTAGRAVLDRSPVHVHDLRSEEGKDFPEARALTQGHRTVLSVPLLREGESVGAITLRRTEVSPFSDKQIALLQTFADQAVIAIGNVRLFEEVQQRTRELSESLEQQTATSEVLSVISRSAGDLEPVFQSMLENATRICGAQFGLMNLYDGESFHTVGFHNVPPEFEAARKQSFRARPDGDLGQMVHTKQVVHIHDLRTRPLYLEGDPATVQLADLAGARTILIVPMVKDDEFVGTIGIYRLEVSPFNEKQVALLSSFASQAVIAIENTRLLRELRARTDDLTRSLDDLRTAQGRLIQTEKLASLGQLTAGIAHEIKNPLNFVNNFAALSAELTDELNDVLKPAAISDKIREEVDELTGLLKDNLQKVVQHGKRADSIVKNMLLHSREGSGDHRPADINALIDESLNLAYHGARAERPDFNVTLQRDFDASAGMVELFPQEITRVFLNLVSNGFYAVNKRRVEAGQAGFDPVLVAATRNLGDAVEIRIRDNGTGIPPEVKDKMFNPFFTTKPAGEGTGLGLSMSHDIIVKQHGGTIDVDTEPGQFTEFRIVLPRTSNSTNKNRGQT